MYLNRDKVIAQGICKAFGVDIQKGEGDRGGHVIGHTPKGNPIYGSPATHINKDIDNKKESDANKVPSIEFIQSKIDQLEDEDYDKYEELVDKNTLDLDDIDNVDLPSIDKESQWWQVNLCKEILTKLGVSYTVNSSKYLGFKIKGSDETYKLRIANHPIKYGADGNIEYDEENDSPEDILEMLKRELPDGEIVRDADTMAKTYHEIKSRPSGKMSSDEKSFITAMEKIL